LELLEKTVLRNVDENEVIQLGKDLISIPSFTGEETQCAEFLAEYMEKRGFQVEMQETEPGRLQPIATMQGTGDGPTLMYNGHIDIDPLPKDMKDPFNAKVKEGRVWGAGFHNMKAGVTAMVMAACALKKADIQLKGDLIITPVVGELQGGFGTMHLIKKGLRPDAVVVTEPTHLAILTKHAGIVQTAITVLGKSQHISKKEEAIDAIKKMSKVLNALYRLEAEKKWTYEFDPELPGLPRMLVGSIIGGRGKKYELRGPYSVSDVCTILTDTRINDSQSAETVKKDLISLLDQLVEEDPDLDYELQLPPLPFGADKVVHPPHKVSKNEYIVQSVKKFQEKVTGKTALVGAQTNTTFPICYAGDDDAFFTELGIPAFCYGPAAKPIQGFIGQHHPVDVSDLITCTKVLALTALDFCTKTKKEYYKIRSKSRLQ
jgi:acetylornithine deacetylase